MSAKAMKYMVFLVTRSMAVELIADRRPMPDDRFLERAARAQTLAMATLYAQGLSAKAIARRLRPGCC